MEITKLIYQVEQGDVKAEKELYDYCYRHCFKIAAIYCKDKNTATSVFNHTMIAVFEKLSSLARPAGLVNYVARVLKNDCIDHIRRQTVYQNKLVTVAENTSNMVAINTAISALAMEDIMELVNKLKPEYRVCFLLHALDDYTYREIAEELAININTAKWYVVEAKKELQKGLKNY